MAKTLCAHHDPRARPTRPMRSRSRKSILHRDTSGPAVDAPGCIDEPVSDMSPRRAISPLAASTLGDMPRLIHLNGPSRVGKSTLARRYVDAHPWTLALDL